MQPVVLPNLAEELLKGLCLVDLILASHHCNDVLWHFMLLDDVVPLSWPCILQHNVHLELMLRPLNEQLQWLLVQQLL